MTSHAKELASEIVTHCSQRSNTMHEMIDGMVAALAVACTVCNVSIGTACAYVAQEMMVCAASEAQRVADMQTRGEPIDDSDARWLS